MVQFEESGNGSQGGNEPDHCQTVVKNDGLAGKIMATADALKAVGCSSLEIRLAALALCGVPVEPVRKSDMRTFG